MPAKPIVIPQRNCRTSILRSRCLTICGAWSRTGACVLVLAAWGCTAAKPIALPMRTGPSATERLAAADALVRAGCFDCIRAAFQEYKELRAIASVADRAAFGA